MNFVLGSHGNVAALVFFHVLLQYIQSYSAARCNEIIVTPEQVSPQVISYFVCILSSNSFRGYSLNTASFIYIFRTNCVYIYSINIKNTQLDIIFI